MTEPGANPFETPATAPEPASPRTFVLASRNSRAIGVSIDGLVYLVAVLPAFVAFALGSEDGMLLLGGLAALMFLTVLVYQTYLVATTGQSIGKRLVGTRIVRTNGAPVEFVHGVLIRSWLMGLLTGIPMVGSFVSLIDVLLIFGQDRRCLHDHIADTIVIAVEATSTPTGDGEFPPTNPWSR
jgi:uncharacterized RDD family membrane protein YckC